MDDFAIREHVYCRTKIRVARIAAIGAGPDALSGISVIVLPDQVPVTLDGTVQMAPYPQGCPAGMTKRRAEPFRIHVPVSADASEDRKVPFTLKTVVCTFHDPPSRKVSFIAVVS